MKTAVNHRTSGNSLLHIKPCWFLNASTELAVTMEMNLLRNSITGTLKDAFLQIPIHTKATSMVDGESSAFVIARDTAGGGGVCITNRFDILTQLDSCGLNPYNSS